MALDKNYFVYINANEKNTVLYIGMTNNLERRTYEHKRHLIRGFSSKYNVDKLVHIEHFNNVNEAITREKQLKNWRREKKVNLINKYNPKWKDLSEGWPGINENKKKKG